jgi:myo-inositol-1(or 4)-monophosphatase
MPRSALLTVMVNAAFKAGRALVRDFGEVENLQVSRKGPADFVSNADRRAEQIVFEELRKARPTYAFLMEEGGEVAGTDGQHRWIVDPLDGTTNFLHGIPMFAVAIALERGQEIVASVIFNPVMDELFTAEKGGGAWLGDRKRLRVAGRRHLADSVIATGIRGGGAGDDALIIRQIAHLAPATSGIRRTGSASTDLAWLAAGRFDGYWESRLSPWDVAPGWLMLREAGGTMTDYAGTPGSIWNGQVVAANEDIHRQLLKALQAVK